ncbi:MAG: hypothetical protein F8N15_10570 [Methanobacterium sp.]|nr:hypothetical protein [Methanobacterium sp.]
MYPINRMPTSEERKILRALVEAGGQMCNETVAAMGRWAWPCVETINQYGWVLVSTTVFITDEGREALAKCGSPGTADEPELSSEEIAKIIAASIPS